MKTEEYVLGLIKELIEKLYSNEELSLIINDSKRIAKLRGDYYNLMWLDLESNKLVHSDKQSEFFKDYIIKFNQSEFESYRKDFFEKWINERELMIRSLSSKNGPNSEKKVLPVSVGEIEVEIKSTIERRKNLINSDGMHHQDKYFIEKAKSSAVNDLIGLENGMKQIISRIKTRVHNFLSDTELNILSGKKLSTYFDDNKSMVDEYLISLSPKFKHQIIDLENRLDEKTDIGLSQALLIIRIILKDLADCLYPSTKNKVIGLDGKERILSDDKYISRIWQFIYENLIFSKTSLNIIDEQLKDLGKKLDLVYEKSCKGVHSSVTHFEVSQCVILFYISIGDLIRITKTQ
ncbi:hypothetical protein QO206_13945 [Leeuwenhoekiella aequorea]|uniref:hypothetical protein n=1 Tax=Leeuwenhoekiella aequorea TaxID=283736 RepID=UPI00352E15C0